MRRRIVHRQVTSPLQLPDPLLGRILAARGISDVSELDHSLRGLLPPDGLTDIDKAGALLADAVRHGKSILIVGDFDADGATSCALMVSGLTAMGAVNTGYLVPDRFRFGYGLTPAIVEVAALRSPDLLVTVDNGIASIEGVSRANALGMDVIVTDHHLPGTELPDAVAIINPNRRDCDFASKHLAGVGVAFYLLSAVRQALAQIGWFEGKSTLNLADLLDLVALGTIADVVVLDQNNRRLVAEGVRRIRAGRGRAGIRALLEVAGADYRYVTTRDLAFSVAPRLNAAGRLQDMSLGIECLLADGNHAPALARTLNDLNIERRDIEQGMRDEALAYVERLTLDDRPVAGLCLYQPDWHEGVVGIVAARIKEKIHRPVIAFASTGSGELKGSGRSVPGFHMRDALDAIATAHPGLLSRFGGHAMAAGLSIEFERLPEFSRAFDRAVEQILGLASMEQLVISDGSLGQGITLALARSLETVPWGQGLPEPEFDDKFEVLDQRLLGGRHVKLLLQPEAGEPVDAICFNHGGLIENRRIHCTYRIEVNRYRDREKPQLVVTVIA